MCTSLRGEDGVEVRDDWTAPGPLNDDQVRIEVHAVSLNFPDVLITRGLYQLKPDPPFVVGSEAAGVVTEVGAGVTGPAVGDRVLTLAGIGAFAGELVVTPPYQHLHVLPPDMPFADAAAFDLTFGTAGHALLQRGGLQEGEWVLVTGAAGGCGSAAVQVARAAGARVVAVVGGRAKADVAGALGADQVIDHRLLDGERALSERVKELTDGRGVDVVVDNVGWEIRDISRCLAWNGRLLVVGFAGGDIPSLPLNLTILRSISAVGVAYGASAIADPAGNRRLMEQLFTWYREGRVRPHFGTRVGPDGAVDALRSVHDRTVVGKAVVEFVPS